MLVPGWLKKVAEIGDTKARGMSRYGLRNDLMASDFSDIRKNKGIFFFEDLTMISVRGLL